MPEEGRVLVGLSACLVWGAHTRTDRQTDRQTGRQRGDTPSPARPAWAPEGEGDACCTSKNGGVGLARRLGDRKKLVAAAAAAAAANSSRSAAGRTKSPTMPPRLGSSMYVCLDSKQHPTQNANLIKKQIGKKRKKRGTEQKHPTAVKEKKGK